MDTEPRRSADTRDGRPPRKSLGRRLGDEILRLAFQRSLTRRECYHPTGARAAPAPPLACPGCVRESSSWVQLRMCLACGSVGCCDSSAGLHAVGHYRATGHPVMRSIEPGDTWGWCYVDQAYLSLEGAA